MRQVLSWRFVATLAVLAGLTLLITALFTGNDTVARIAERGGPDHRRADLITLVLKGEQKDFVLRPNGFTRGQMTLELLDDRTVTIFPGTPGSISCEQLDDFARCALLAETLGDTVVWFALVPMGSSFTFELPPIDSLDGGYATLANGWQVPYASVIDRERCDSPAESFSEFLRLVGRRHRSLFSVGRGEITAVVC